MSNLKRNSLRKAFVELRKKGYFARMNFQCCTGCGCAAIPKENQEKYAFYHNQDNTDLKETGTCYVAWNGDGAEIQKVFDDYGIITEWDGTSQTKIRICI